MDCGNRGRESRRGACFEETGQEKDKCKQITGV